MVRGNWQKRVETAQSRRDAQRRRKARKSDRDAYRTLASGLVSFLDGLDGLDADGDGDGCGGSSNGCASADGGGRLDVWVDSPPPGGGRSDGGTTGAGRGGGGGGGDGSDDDDDDGGGRGRKSRRGGGRRRQQQQSTKKAHPRSHASAADDADSERPGAAAAGAASLMCAHHFFAGKCPGGGGGGGTPRGGKGGGKRGGGGGTGCKLEHCDGLTIATMLKRARGEAGADSSDAAAAAAIAALAGDGEDSIPASGEEGAMEMVWHVAVPPGGRGDSRDGVTTKDDNDDGGGEGEGGASRSRGRHVTALHSALSKQKCGVASVVYATWDGTLIYDRYRGGALDLSQPTGDNGDGDDVKPAASSARHDEKNDGSRTSGRGRARSRGDSTVDGGQEASDGAVGAGTSTAAVDLPGSVLELVLTFLPDAATGALPRVCTAWQGEVGRHSPDLWRYLLKRRGWPMPPPPSPPLGASSVSPRDAHRSLFVSTYEAWRDLTALGAGAKFLNSPTGGGAGPSPPPDAAVLRYAPTRGAPSVTTSGGAAVVKVWDEGGRVLAAYPHDCTLRLFEAVPPTKGDGGGTGGGLSCRQAVCVRVAPGPNSRKPKGWWTLVHMDLDDDFIGCVCTREPPFHGVRVPLRREAPHLVVVRKDDVLCTSGGGYDGRPAEMEEGTLASFDLREAVICYLLSCEDSEQQMPGTIRNYLGCDEDHSLFEFRIFSDLVACGGGRFLFEAAFLDPSLEGAAAASEEQLQGRKMCLFSASQGKFMWVANSDPSFRGHLNAGIHLSRDWQHSASPTSSCQAVLTTSITPEALSVTVHRSGDVECRPFGDNSPVETDRIKNILSDEIAGWSELFPTGAPQNANRLDYGRRPFAATPSEFAIAHNIEITTGERSFPHHRAVLTFSSRPANDGAATSASAMTLEGECIVRQIEALGSEHLVLMCRASKAPLRMGAAEGNPAPEEDIQGDWFGHADVVDDAGDDDIAAGDAPANDVPANDVEEPNDFECLILVHAPTRLEIGRVHLKTSMSGHSSPFCLCAGKGTVALEAEECVGMILTGSGLRGIDSVKESDADEGRSAKKKKKKRQPNRGGKKDGFARGMSLRG